MGLAGVLQCLQRSCDLNVATQRRGWRHNWYTRGSSFSAGQGWRRLFPDISMTAQPSEVQDGALVSLSDAAGGPPTVALCMSFEPHSGSRPGLAELFEVTTPREWLESSATVQLRGLSMPAALINLSPVRRQRPARSAGDAAFRAGLLCVNSQCLFSPPPASHTELHCAHNQRVWWREVRVVSHCCGHRAA